MWTKLTLSVTAAALIMKSLTDTLTCSEKTKKKSLSHDWTRDFSHIRPADLDASDQDLGDSVPSLCCLQRFLASISAMPDGYERSDRSIHDLTVKSCRPWTMRVRKNNRGERIPRYTHHLSNGSGMAAPVSSITETGLKGFTVCLEAWQAKLNRANYVTARWPKCLKISNCWSPLMCVGI